MLKDLHIKSQVAKAAGCGVMLLGLAVPSITDAAELWELPPIRYSKSVANDPLAKLMVDVEAGRK